MTRERLQRMQTGLNPKRIYAPHPTNTHRANPNP